ncbi:MAG: DUF1566 domain-containing protein [Candidatus Thiodiazotropha sp. (ex Myrtea sp. 'scaly one' KF741663)]|nr:DUF1566 domain-containing protein [Candidatus Thiodiazotropha sp. (ex Myrtea sp. 'scaly one' KF741663)]
MNGWFKGVVGLWVMTVWLSLSGCATTSGVSLPSPVGSPHSGWVVDADTGEPVAGVFVMRYTKGSKYPFDIEVSTIECHHNQMTITDRDGYYELPAYTPGLSYRNAEWIVSYKPGYTIDPSIGAGMYSLEKNNLEDRAMLSVDFIHRDNQRPWYRSGDISYLNYCLPPTIKDYPLAIAVYGELEKLRQMENAHPVKDRKMAQRIKHSMESSIERYCLDRVMPREISRSPDTTQQISCDLSRIPVEWKDATQRFLAKAETSSGMRPPQGQTCSTNFWERRSAERFKDNGDGTVSDSKTGLMWKRCSEGQIGPDCVGKAEDKPLQEAKMDAQKSTFAGHDDWRLPSTYELQSLLVKPCYGPSIDTRLFPSTPNWYYWASSSPPRSGSQDLVEFGYGTVDMSSFGYHYSRLVRGPRFLSEEEKQQAYHLRQAELRMQALVKAGKGPVSDETAKRFADALSAVVYKSLQESAASNPKGEEARHLAKVEAKTRKVYKKDFRAWMSNCIKRQITPGAGHTQQDLDRARQLAWKAFGRQLTEQEAAEIKTSLEGYDMEKGRGGTLFSRMLSSCKMQADADY